MLHDKRLNLANALILHWHAGAPSIGFEAFQSWVLTTLKAHVRFDGALWCAIDAQEHATPRRIGAAHLHRIAAEALEHFEQVRGELFAEGPDLGRLHNVCIEDARWDAPEHSAMRLHGRRHGLANTLAMLIGDASPSTRQLVVLSRKAASNRFSADEARAFELLAPHMVLAHATCRTLFVHAAATGDRRSADSEVAVIDRFGVVHDQSPRFVSMLRREWSDWPGKRLPEPVLELVERRAATRWQFLGSQVAADFVPVDDLCLVTARPRQVTDALTSRETAVARRYAAGGSFREIAESLKLAPATVRSHLRNVYAKLQVRNKTQLATALRGR